MKLLINQSGIRQNQRVSAKKRITHLCWRATRPRQMIWATSICVGHSPAAMQPKTPQLCVIPASSLLGLRDPSSRSAVDVDAELEELLEQQEGPLDDEQGVSHGVILLKENEEEEQQGFSGLSITSPSVIELRQ